MNEHDIQIRDLILTLWRRKILFIGVFLTGLSLALIALQFIQPQYTARTLLLIEGNVRSAAEDLQVFSQTIKFDNALILGETEVLRSRVLAAQVAKKLNLMTDPEFNAHFKSVTSNPVAFKTMTVQTIQSQATPPDIVDATLQNITGQFLKRLTVRPIPGSFAISIEYKSRNPQKAALIANTLAKTYIDTNIEAQYESTKTLTNWLDKRLGELREQVRIAEQAAAQHRALHNLTGTVNDNKNVQDLDTSIMTAYLEKDAAEAHVAQLKTLVQNHNLIDSAPSNIINDFIRSLKLDVVRLERNIQELSTRYGPKHPLMKSRQAELQNLKKTINGEIQKRIEEAQDTVDLIDQKIATLEITREDLGFQNLENNKALIKLRELEQEAESSRSILNSFLETYKKSKRQEELEKPTARIISYAAPPGRPSYPNKGLIISLSAVMSLFIGLAIVFLLEALDDRVKNLNILEQKTGLNIIGRVPAPKGTSKNNLNISGLHAQSALKDNIRALFMVLSLQLNTSGPKKPHVITVTSSMPQEHKTLLSLWLAQTAAQSNRRTVIVDCDLHNAKLSQMIQSTPPHTLNDYINGHATLDNVLTQYQNTNLQWIGCKIAPEQTLNLLDNEKFTSLTEELKQRFDVIILDSPACLTAPDVHLLTRVSDHVLYAVHHFKTRYSLVLNGVKSLQNIHKSAMSMSLIITGFKK